MVSGLKRTRDWEPLEASLADTYELSVSLVKLSGGVGLVGVPPPELPPEALDFLLYFFKLDLSFVGANSSPKFAGRSTSAFSCDSCL